MAKNVDTEPLILDAPYSNKAIRMIWCNVMLAGYRSSSRIALRYQSDGWWIAYGNFFMGGASCRVADYELVSEILQLVNKGATVAKILEKVGTLTHSVVVGKTENELWQPGEELAP